MKTDRDRWWNLANAVMRPGIARNMGEFLDYVRLLRKDSVP